MKLFLIRHGQTDWNIQGKIQGSHDTELNQTGIEQAELLSKKVVELNYKFSKIYTSQQKRAMKTAQILSCTVKEDCIPIIGLQEVNYGEWEGLCWREIQDKFPEEYQQWYNHRRYTRPPKGESYDDMLKRVLTVLHKIVNENSSDVAIVTHGAVIMSLQCYLTNTPFDEMTKFKTDNTSITEFDSELFL
ncbi:MAG: histidine phosphatase family protein [Clostridiaceae bacterium]|nr:histidine phosphatase family protein [Clostridiaceae bacterium]